MPDHSPGATWEDINSLTPWDQNPRHNDHAVNSIADSIQAFGWSNPIIARSADRVIIAGHTRYKAAQKLGLDKVLVRFMDLDPARARALALADNKLGELAQWDQDKLTDQLTDLQGVLDMDLTLLGWSTTELDHLLQAPPAEAEQEAGEWTEFDEGIGDDAPQGRSITCPHCNQSFEA